MADVLSSGLASPAADKGPKAKLRAVGKEVIKNAKQRKGDAAEPAASLSSTLTDIAAAAPGPEASGSTDKKPHAKHRRADSQELSPPVAVEPPNTRIPTYRQGDRCRVGDKHGVVQFVGTIPTLGQGVWCGIQFDEPVASRVL